jgi:hypothetical protein
VKKREPLEGDEAEESFALGTSQAFMKIVERSRAEFEAGRTLTFEEMKRAVLPEPEDLVGS